ncbi:protein FREE1-like isoform X2 [Toxotes jaculatrix]|uniref:protein FREE1-like isoform X2 n=1 Tax=Toxotes jaculatrix TaxID=941984 RepID=UPI001B3ADAD3|nr:protein FREE1-like isoform X2 [Toxotes jaculatrix]
MKTALFFLGAPLFALLIVDVGCLPVKKGFDPSGSYGGHYTNAAGSFGSNEGAPSSHHNVASGGVSVPSYQPSPQPGPGSSGSAVLRRPAAPASSGFSSRPVTHSGIAVTHPVGLTQPGAALQPVSRDVDWAVPPPGIFSGGEGAPAGPPAVGFSSAEYVSPPRPPPGPMYQAGELSHFEESYEDGDYQRETEEQGYLPPPQPLSPVPVHESPSVSFTSPPRPGPGLGRGWYVYPYYDYMFLTGQYPPGTVTDLRSNFEQGSDFWYDDHYIRYYPPYSPGPVQQPEAFTGKLAVPQSFEAREPSVTVGYGPGGAAAGLPGSSRRRFMQPTSSRARVSVPGKVGY